MNRAEVRRRALRYLDEDPESPVHMTETEANELIDEALEIVSEEIRYVKKTGYVPLRDGCQIYRTMAIDPLLLSITRIWLMDCEHPLELTSMMELSRSERRWWEHTEERPHHWYPVDHQTFGVYPRVAESQGEVLRIDYLSWASPTQDDTVQLPFDDPTLDAVINYVVHCGLLKRWDIARASDIYGEFVNLFGDAHYKREVRRYNYALLQRVNHAANGRVPY